MNQSKNSSILTIFTFTKDQSFMTITAGLVTSNAVVNDDDNRCIKDKVVISKCHDFIAFMPDQQNTTIVYFFF